MWINFIKWTDIRYQILQEAWMKIGRVTFQFTKWTSAYYDRGGGGFRKRRRHHNKSQDQCSTLKNYLEVIIPKIGYPGKKPNDWSLDVEAKSRHWETLPSVTAEWKQVMEDDYAISEQWNWWNSVWQVIVSHILSYCPWELQLLLAFPSLSFPGAHALLQPRMHWPAPLYA